MRKGVLELKQLSIGYDSRSLLSKIDLTLKSGELTCLLGANGSGKSTLLKTISKFQKPLSGQILFSGEDSLKYSNREWARVLSFQLPSVPPSDQLTVRELAQLGRYPYSPWWRGIDREGEGRVEEALEALELKRLKDHRLSQLSDGERQRASLTRVFVQDPEIIVLDEPTAFLDINHKVELFRYLKEWAHQKDRTVLLSTHDLDCAISLSDSLWLIGNQGGISQGCPEDLILQGKLSEVFRHPHVQIDRESGRVSLIREGKGRIRIQGEKLALTWTMKALERVGYQMDQNSENYVNVNSVNGPWSLFIGENGTECSSIEELLEILKQGKEAKSF